MKTRFKIGDQVKLNRYTWSYFFSCLNEKGAPNKITLEKYRGNKTWGTWMWTGESRVSFKQIHEDEILHVITEDTEYIDARFEEMDKLGLEINDLLDLAEVEIPYLLPPEILTIERHRKGRQGTLALEILGKTNCKPFGKFPKCSLRCFDIIWFTPDKNKTFKVKCKCKVGDFRDDLTYSQGDFNMINTKVVKP